MRKIYTILLLMVSLQVGWSQTWVLSRINNLEAKLDKATSPVQQCHILCNMAYTAQTHISMEKSEYYLLKGDSIAKKHSLMLELNRNNNIRGYNEFWQGNFNNALAIFLRTTATAKKLNNNYQIIINLKACAKTYEMLGVPAKALEYYNQAESYINDDTDLPLVNTLYVQIAKFHNELNNRQLASLFLIKAIEHQKYTEKKKGTVNKQSSNLLFGELYAMQKNYKKAMMYYQKVLESQSNNSDGISVIRRNELIGNLYIDQNNFEKALEYYKQELFVAQQLVTPFQAFNAKINIAHAHLLLDNYTEALKILKELESQLIHSNAHYKVDLYYYVYSLYYSRMGQVDKAIESAELSNDIMEVRKKFIHKAKALYLLQDLYGKKGVDDKAYQYLRTYNSIADSLNNTFVTEALTVQKMEDEFENERAVDSLEKKVLGNKIKYQNLLLLAASCIILLITISIYLVKKFYNKRNQLLTEDVKNKAIIEEQAANLLTLNEKLKNKNKDLEDLNEMKTLFFVNISHELRTPLTLIQAPMESILNSETLNNENFTKLSRIYQSTKKLSNLITSILDISKFDADKLKLNETTEVFYLLIRRTVAAFETYAQQKEIKLSLEYQGRTDLLLDIDKEKFEAILTNYLSNAIKFTPKRGEVTVIVKDLKNRIELSVVDTGIGIAKEELGRVFERYYQAKNYLVGTSNQVNYHAGGTGIGLSLCDSYAQLFGGKVWAESPNWHGQGCSFYFEFPIKEVLRTLETVERVILNSYALVSEEVQLPFETKETSILVVEDNHDLRLFLTELLSERYNVFTAEDGSSALKHLETHPLPSMIITDVMMPIMDGFELLNYLKNSNDFRHIPVMILSARSEMNDKLKALRIGVDDYLPKPFNEKELKIRIENIINRYNNRSIAIGEAEGILETEIQNEQLKISNSEAKWLENLENTILQNIENADFTADHIAEKLLMSRTPLFKKIKTLTGLTLNQYVKEVRLQKAKELLESGSINVAKNIATSVGFKHSNYFSKLYEERFGKRPSDYL